MKKIFNIKILLWSLLIIFSILFFLVPEFDESISKFVVNLRTDGLTTFFKTITILGNTESIVIIAIIALIIFNTQKERTLIIANSLGMWLLNYFIKFVVSRPRPLDIALIEETGNSFPSGHAMVSMSLFGIIIIFICKRIKSKAIKYLLAFIVGLIVILIAISRVYLGVHYYTDITCGMLISLIVINYEVKSMRGRLKK